MAEESETNESPENPSIGDYPSIISAIRSPLSLFGLIMLVSNGVFAISAASMEAPHDIEAFKYAIHMFLSIVGAFIMIAIWVPRSLYHPRELKGIEGDIIGPTTPRAVVTVVLLLVMFAYMAYQAGFITKLIQKLGW